VVKCDDVKGKAVSSNKKLVKCLQPNRRVVVEVKGLK
jgi:OOP family OmpA-OmpF porin